ncbi:MAG: GH39 family glycosyl hydrolase, partial [Opitutaceae bacterium]
NEPNLDFWTGEPKQATYFELYDAAARAIKGVASTIRVGGPATAQAAWIPAFIQHCADHHVPLDFVSTHIYGDDPPRAVGADHPVSMRDLVGLATRKVFREVGSSPMPHLPIIFSEFNATSSNNPAITDSSFMGPWIADTIRECDGFTTVMSYWDFSDVFDEQGVVRKPFYGGYGLIAEGHIPKPSFNAFAMLHHLGTERLPAPAPWILATRRSDGSLAIAVWHYAPPRAAGPDREYDIEMRGWKGADTARVQILDAHHGSALGAWNRMGSPAYPSQEQERELQESAKLPAPTSVNLTNGTLKLFLPVHALALVQLSSGPGG